MDAKISAKDVFIEFKILISKILSQKPRSRTILEKANLDKLKEKHIDHWWDYECLAAFFNKNKDINFIKFLEHNFKYLKQKNNNIQYVSPRYFLSKKAKEVYNECKEKDDYATEILFAYDKIITSIKNVIHICKKENISFNTFKEQYIKANISGIPTIVSYIDANKISKYFLILIPDFIIYLQTWANDIKNEYNLTDEKFEKILRISRQAIYFNTSRFELNVEKIIEKRIRRENVHIAK